jgi:hypothetical protein
MKELTMDISRQKSTSGENSKEPSKLCSKTLAKCLMPKHNSIAFNRTGKESTDTLSNLIASSNKPGLMKTTKDLLTSSEKD